MARPGRGPSVWPMEPQNPAGAVEPTERVELLMRDLRSSPQGISAAEAARRLIQYGPNELRRRGGPGWPRELARQLTHPLALLLWLAAVLSFAVGNQTVAIAVLLVIVLNALFAFVQEMQAERAVEALAKFLPQHVRSCATARSRRSWPRSSCPATWSWWRRAIASPPTRA